MPTSAIKHLSNHYVLKVGNKFMVFTSNPLPSKELITKQIPGKNIDGFDIPQYIVLKVHTVDPMRMFFEAKAKGIEYFINNQNELQQYLEKIING